MTTHPLCACNNPDLSVELRYLNGEDAISLIAIYIRNQQHNHLMLSQAIVPSQKRTTNYLIHYYN